MDYKELQGKKLLILGGDARSKDIVEAANQMGVYTIVTDWYDVKRSPAKLIASEYWNEEVFRPDKLAVLVRERGINGVITGFSDSYLLQYQKLCELTGLPCYATREIFETTLDKASFKNLCRDNGVPVVPEYNIESFNPALINEFNKVLIKPVDNSGSRGIITCADPKQFKQSLEYALQFSEKKQVVIEKFLDMDTFSVSYTIQDGVISMSTMNDRLVLKSPDAGAVTSGGIYPSKYIDSYIQKMDGKVKRMYQNLGVRNGVLFIQGFTNGKEYYFFEMGYRLSGGRHYIFTENQNNTSSIKNLISFALTGKMANYSIAERDNPRFNNKCYQLNILGHQAKISRIEGYEYVRNIPEVICASLLKKEGDEIGKGGTTAQQVLGIYMVVQTEEHFREIAEDVFNHFKLLDENGNNLVIKTI